MKIICFLLLLFSNISTASNNDLEIRIEKIKHVLADNKFEEAFSLSEDLITDYPSNIEAHFIIVGVQTRRYGLDKPIQSPSKVELQQIDKLATLIQKCVEIIDRNNHALSPELNDYLILYAELLSTLKQDRLAVNLYNKSYILERDLKLEKYQVTAIHYAESLARLKLQNEFHNVYLMLFQENGTNEDLVRTYIEDSSIYFDPNEAIKLAIGYMQQNGFSDIIKVELCRIYQRYNSNEQALLCHKELVAMGKDHVSPKIMAYSQDFIKSHSG